jgi:hypothetical protein
LPARSIYQIVVRDSPVIRFTSLSRNTRSIASPSDPRSPLDGVLGACPEPLASVSVLVSGQLPIQPASNYGDPYNYWSGVDLTLAMRASNGITFQGGTSTGQTVQDICGVSNQLPDALQAAQTVAVGVRGFSALGSGQTGMAPGSTAISHPGSRRSSGASPRTRS